MEEPKRFVIQEHQRETEPTHWDLMLERDGVLETYRVPEPPEKWGEKAVSAVKISDHSLKFLSYEGSVNKGKGRVEIADAGTYTVLIKRKKQWQLEFTGRILRGRFRLLPAKKAKWQLKKSDSVL